MKTGRILLVVIALFLMNSSIVNARVFKIATVSPDGTFWMQEMRAGAKEIKKKTQGRQFDIDSARYCYLRITIPV